MYKLFLASVIALAVLLPLQAVANPETTQIVQVKKKKKATKVKEANNPFLRCEGFSCGTQPKKYNAFSHERSSADETAADFFRQNMLMTQLLLSPLDPPDYAKKDKDCWFNCNNNNVVVMEAKKWEGKTAKKNRKELKELFAGTDMPIDPARIPWCAAFANAILNRSGYETTNSLMARSFLHWGSKTKQPRDGDIVVLKRGHSNATGHVGFFQGYEWFGGVQYVKVLGGNTDNAVQIAYFPTSAVLGYRTAIA
jgi:uncharacterized protein (TIGR02594 family)